MKKSLSKKGKGFEKNALIYKGFEDRRVELIHTFLKFSAYFRYVSRMHQESIRMHVGQKSIENDQKQRKNP